MVVALIASIRNARHWNRTIEAQSRKKELYAVPKRPNAENSPRISNILVTPSDPHVSSHFAKHQACRGYRNPLGASAVMAFTWTGDHASVRSFSIRQCRLGDDLPLLDPHTPCRSSSGTLAPAGTGPLIGDHISTIVLSVQLSTRAIMLAVASLKMGSARRAG